MLIEPQGSIEASFHDVTILTTPKSLIDLCTKYDVRFHMCNDGEDKVNFDFEFKTEDGITFLVYDWKEYRSLSMNEPIEFHIGAKDRYESLEAFATLQEELGNLYN